MKKLLLVAYTSLLLIAACKKSETIAEPEEEPIALNFSVARLRDPANEQAEQGYGTSYNFLGHGYDLTGQYSHISAVRAAVLNTPAFVEANPGRFDFGRIIESSSYNEFAKDSQALASQLTNRFASNLQNLDSISYFKGSITRPFPLADANAANYIYGLHDIYLRQNRLRLYVGSEPLIPFLTEGFKADLESLTAAALIEKYGTHILLSLYTGAKFSVYYQAEYSGHAAQKAVEESFRIGLEQSFGFFSGFLDQVDSTYLRGISNPKMIFEATGGNLSKIVVDEAVAPTKVNVSAWAASIPQEQIKFVYLDDSSTLLPLHELIAEENKKAEVKNYIEEYLKSQEVKLE